MPLWGVSASQPDQHERGDVDRQVVAVAVCGIEGEAMLIAKEIIPAPEGEDYRAYNAAVIQALTKELIGSAERERLDKTPWARSLVNELIQRIANLRALHKCATDDCME